MAITILQQPPAFAPAYNELMYVVSSANTANTNFKFVCDIWLEGGSAYIARVLLNTIPGTSQCVFDAHRIIENYLSSDIGQTADFVINSNSYLRFQVKFGEQYGSTPVVYPSLATSAMRTVYNGIFDYTDFVGYDYTDWQLVKGAQKNCLTNAPLTQYIEQNQSQCLYFAPSGANTVSYLLQKYYGADGVQIGAAGQLFNTYTAATDYHQRVGIGTYDGGIFNPDIAYFTTQLFDNTDSPVSALYTHYITCNPKYTTQRIHFQNKLGGYDAFNFTAIHRTSSAITRQSYRKNTGQLVGNSWVNSRQQRGMTVYDATVDDTLHLISGYISEAESLWLEELFTSPEVYLEQLVGGAIRFLPYVVTSNTYSVMQKEADKLINIEIDLQPAVQRRRQRG